ARLAAMSPARARNLLRWFLRGEGLRPPSTARLTAMLAQLQAAGAEARTRLLHDGAEIGCHRGRILVHAAAADPFVRAWRGEGSVPLPGGTLLFERVRGAGAAAAKFATAEVTLRSRRGGERIQLAANRPRRAVKKLLYDAQLPSWQRQSLPFIWCGDELAALPGIGVALAFQAQADEAGWRIEWRPW
ncbi:MAG TPA: tRNA lysidine(34) synthetase TilS, partial [Casimicrobiaceae bacterium]